MGNPLPGGGRGASEHRGALSGLLGMGRGVGSTGNKGGWSLPKKGQDRAEKPGRFLKGFYFKIQETSMYVPAEGRGQQKEKMKTLGFSAIPQD